MSTVKKGFQRQISILVTSNPDQGPFFTTMLSAWMSNYIHYKVCDEITYPLQNFNGTTAEV